VVGGVTQACREAAVALYSQIVARVVPVSSTQTAEMVKLLENTFRAVNIALVNEAAIMCDKLDIDVWEVIEAAATKPYGFMKFTPGPGVGGHCIPLDPHYLSWKLRTLNYNARFVQLAGEINSEMPRYWVEKVRIPLTAPASPSKIAGCWSWAWLTRRTLTMSGSPCPRHPGAVARQRRRCQVPRPARAGHPAQWSGVHIRTGSRSGPASRGLRCDRDRSLGVRLASHRASGSADRRHAPRQLLNRRIGIQTTVPGKGEVIRNEGPR